MIIDVTKEVTIGEFEFDNAISELAIETNDKNKFSDKKIGIITVDVLGHEGGVPHVHLNSKATGFDTCICLHAPLYFPHGGKHQDKLNKSQAKAFNEWMKKKNVSHAYKSPNKDRTNFETACDTWKELNPCFFLILIISRIIIISRKISIRT